MMGGSQGGMMGGNQGGMGMGKQFLISITMQICETSRQ